MWAETFRRLPGEHPVKRTSYAPGRLKRCYSISVEATKYAVWLLKDHCAEGKFIIWFPSPEECDTMADRFKKLGCEVQEDRRKQVVEVICPTDLDVDKLESSIGPVKPPTS